MAFETALRLTAAKMVGKWYIGVVLEAANRCMIRWHGDKIDTCSLCPASVMGGIHGDGEWGGGGQEELWETRVDQGGKETAERAARCWAHT